jgi:hypothetical protein
MKGKNFLEGATVRVIDDMGAEVAVASIARRSAKQLVVVIDDVIVGAALVLIVVNPGGVASEPRSVPVP